MDFTFSEEQLMTAEFVRTLLTDQCAGADLRRQMASGAAREAVRWEKLVQMGLGGILVPESAGGLGLGEPDFVLIAEACGHAALPEPLVEHAGIALPLLAAFDGHEPLLARAIAGEATLAIGHPVNPFVADADTAEALLLAHDGALHLVPRMDAKLVRRPSIDPFRRLFIVDWTPTDRTLLAGKEKAAPLLALALDRGALFAAAQCLGIARRAVELAVAYALERKQFGRVIGGYQAIKHHLATCQVRIEFAKPVVAAASAELGRGDVTSRARVSHAKLAACEAADLAARTAIQVHGAMGYSWEVDVHFFLKRALALAGGWGDVAFHRARIAERLQAAPLGPDFTFARS